ncbi:pilus assembly protein [Halomonas pacifica]|uniref:Pilus assembly protein n=1 Tax=Bisbaumannia pacifica TaxID=77098 RepID=A0A510XG95_9GAMM|nr:TadE family protein [Halomonas pacifica]MBH8581513.1 pilus assembly protein [Halomonas pacifica]MDC8805445.1 pilus assembly protein [Halomonas pacifica]GEK47840.1 hypothetical protein HPA02_21230 [Halomonas pacifica]
MTTLIRERRQSGAVAIEFVIFFPLFLVIFYGIVSYSVIFAAQQTLHSLSSEATRAAVAVYRDDPESSLSEIETALAGVIQQRVDDSWISGWLSGCGRESFFNYTRGGAGGRDHLEVCFRVGVGTGEALALPKLSLLGFSIPSDDLTELTSTSSIRL